MMRLHSSWRPRVDDPEAGFTLIEIMVGIVVLSIIMGAVAAAIIIGLDNVNTTQARLAGSSNAQVTSANFVQDVEGAQYVTTNAAAANPRVCGSGAKLLLGLYRPKVTGNLNTGLQGVNQIWVGYWLVTTTPTPEIIRYACTSSTTAATSTLISDDVNRVTQSVASVSPLVFSTAAAAGWSPVQALTTLTKQADLSSATTLYVGSTAGFALSSSLAVVSSTGVTPVSCTGVGTGASGPYFSGCSSTAGSQTIALAGASVSQPTSISAITLSVTQPNAAYTYALTGTPRSFSTYSYGANEIPPPGAPPLLINPLNTCSGFSWNGNANILVNGSIALNNSVMGSDKTGGCSGGECKGGSATINSSGFESTGTNPFDSCSFNGTSTTATQTSTIADPYASLVPAYGSAAFPYRTGANVNPPPSGNTCYPGEYTTASAFANCKVLEPGVYILDQGWTGTVTEDPAGIAQGLGVLIYMPCNPPSGSPKTCSESVSGTFNNLPGLSPVQAAQNLGTSGLAGLSIWQDSGDSSAMSLGGNGASSTTGIIYAPTAALSTSGTSSFTAQSVIVYSVDISGGGHGGGSCNVDLCITG